MSKNELDIVLNHAPESVTGIRQTESLFGPKAVVMTLDNGDTHNVVCGKHGLIIHGMPNHESRKFRGNWLDSCFGMGKMGKMGK